MHSDRKIPLAQALAGPGVVAIFFHRDFLADFFDRRR